MINLKISGIDIFEISNLNTMLEKLEVTAKYRPIVDSKGRQLTCDSVTGDMLVSFLNFSAQTSHDLAIAILVEWFLKLKSEGKTNYLMWIGKSQITSEISKEDLRKILREELQREKDNSN